MNENNKLHWKNITIVAIFMLICMVFSWNLFGKEQAPFAMGTLRTSSEVELLWQNTTTIALAGSIELIDINKASAQELALLPQVGEVIARRIVEYRQEYGAFANIDALILVSGIGEKKLEQMRAYITVE